MKLNDINSTLDIIKGLILNGYEISVKCVYKEWPRENDIDYFEIKYLKKRH